MVAGRFRPEKPRSKRGLPVFGWQQGQSGEGNQRRGSIFLGFQYGSSPLLGLVARHDPWAAWYVPPFRPTRNPEYPY
jgi:hypothetical protein